MPNINGYENRRVTLQANTEVVFEYSNGIQSADIVNLSDTNSVYFLENETVTTGNAKAILLTPGMTYNFFKTAPFKTLHFISTGTPQIQVVSRG